MAILSSPEMVKMCCRSTNTRYIIKRVLLLLITFSLKTRSPNCFSDADSQEKYDRLKEHLVNTDVFFAQVYIMQN